MYDELAVIVEGFYFEAVGGFFDEVRIAVGYGDDFEMLACASQVEQERALFV